MVIKIYGLFPVSQKRACRVLGQIRNTQRHIPHLTSEEKNLTVQIIRLATQYGRYGYRRITARLKQQGWKVNHKRIERIWKREGLKVPKKQPKRGRLWLEPKTNYKTELKRHRFPYI